jgi:hypothetical protein
MGKVDYAMGKKNKHFDEIRAHLKCGEFDFDASHYLNELLVEFRKMPSRCCTWCLLDCIYSVDDINLGPFLPI